jgi:hypothetical protein
LRWRDLDLGCGHIMLDENKTDDPRSWALDPGVARALRAWKIVHHPNATPDDFVFCEPGSSAALYTLHLADELRRDLQDAGVTRRALFERSKVRRPLRVHDLRATFVTVSLANGKTETWVADRTGHRSSVMINRYRRAARTWSELALGPLAPLDEAIADLRLPHGLPHADEVATQRMTPNYAEREGFEPSVPLQVHMISNHAPSATRSSLRGWHRPGVGTAHRQTGRHVARFTGGGRVPPDQPSRSRGATDHIPLCVANLDNGSVCRHRCRRRAVRVAEGA